MNGFLRRMLNLDTGDAAINVIARQQVLIDQLNEAVDTYELRHVRITRDLIEAFYNSIGVVDDDDLREDLERGLRDLNDHVARLEEHAEG